MAEITKAELDELVNSLEGALGTTKEHRDELELLVTLLAMPDDKFLFMAPGVLQSYQQIINNPNDKIALIQSLNASGLKAEDLTASFMNIEEEVEKLEISTIKKDFLKELLATTISAVNDTEGIAKRIVPVAIELCHPNAKMPQYAHQTDSGMDVYALDDITIAPGETVLVPTGLKVALPPGFELQVRPKSGRALKTKLRIANTPGTIDQGYRDEIKIIVENIEPPIKEIECETNMDGETGEIDHMTIKSVLTGSDYTIGKGEKFCQLVLVEVPKAALYRVDSVKDIGEDRGGGFGSTDVE